MQKGLYLNVPARWNLTFMMLDVAQEYRIAFTLMGEKDI